MVLFAPSFPVASAVCYLSNLLEIRTDAYKLLMNTQRPMYAGAEDIGSWMHVLRALAVIGVFTNMGLIGFTSVQFQKLLPFTFLGLKVTHDSRAVFMFLVEHIILGLQLLTMHAVPDYPHDVVIGRALSAPAK